MRDLQRRLAAAGFLSNPGAEPSVYCSATVAAVSSFQSARGLTVTGACDENTWSALVEASWRLGDRLLLLTSPNLRGDDVADLQSRLGRLGFDCGRVDGIFGARTASALEDFQHNCGLHADGVCGTETIRALELLSRQTGSGPGVARLREVEALRVIVGSLARRRIVVGQFGGLSAITRSISRELRFSGAHVITVDEPDAVAQANVANRFGAEVYIGFAGSTGPTSVISYYAVPTFESAGGRSLAERLAGAIRALDGDGAPLVEVQGMRLPVLRETRMTAVLCSLSDVRRWVDHGLALTSSVVSALTSWSASPLVDTQP